MRQARNKILTALLLLFCAHASNLKGSDPLSSWNDGSAKQAIVEFVLSTTNKKSPDFVPEEERIATFDQDGTLWIEKPFSTQFRYCLSRIPFILKEKPELKNREPFKTVLSENEEAIANLTWYEKKKILSLAMSGMPVEQFQEDVKKWITTAKDSRWKRPFPELTYLPMKEVLAYLRANGYKTYIVTGGDQDFVRTFSKKTYGIPKEHVVGTENEVVFSYDKQARPLLTESAKLLLNDVKIGKPKGIHYMIGQRPRAAFGNSIGDKEMLEYTKAGKGLRLCMLVLHDDAKREYAYGPAQELPDSKVGIFTQALYDQAKKQGWIIISMKKDWNRIFSFEKGKSPLSTEVKRGFD